MTGARSLFQGWCPARLCQAILPPGENRPVTTCWSSIVAHVFQGLCVCIIGSSWGEIYFSVFLSSYFLLVKCVGELRQSRKNNPDVCPRCRNVQSTRCSDPSGIPHRLGEYWEQGQAARDQKPKPWASVSDPLKCSVRCLSSRWKNQIQVFFSLSLPPSLSPSLSLSMSVFFSFPSVSRGRLFHHPAGNLHGEGMHTQEYRRLLWELPLVGASPKYSHTLSSHIPARARKHKSAP